MKKIILLLTFTIFLFSCSKDDNSSSSNNNNNNNNTNGNAFTNSMDYEFTITINGEVHKVKGNTTNGIPKGMVLSNWVNNQCEVINSTSKFVMLKINDVTASNYITGQNLECMIALPNLLLGINQAQVSFSGAYFDTLSTTLGAYTIGYGLGFYNFQTVSGVYNSTVTNKLPITITDLGTTSTYILPPYNFGKTLKGNYSGTIYLRNTSNGNFTIPVQLSIDFKALRMY